MHSQYVSQLSQPVITAGGRSAWARKHQGPGDAGGLITEEGTRSLKGKQGMQGTARVETSNR